MDFKGKAARLGPDDFASSLALMPGVEAAALRAVIEVETGGSGFDRQGRPSVLFERHLFWAELGPGPKRDRAAAENLAYPRWGERPYPRSSDGVYAEIDAAAAIDEDAALRSTSWGLGQILGRECGEAGYESARALVLAFMDGEGAQLAAMVRLIKARHLDAALKEHRWADFARVYNGTGYRRNAYDTKLDSAYRKWLAGKPDPQSGPPAANPQVKAAQSSLQRLGFYDGAIDGIAGPVTQAAILAFQRSRTDLVADGVLGPKTAAALTDAEGSTRAPGSPSGRSAKTPADATAGAPTTIRAGNRSQSAGAGAVAGTAAGSIAAAADPAHWLIWALAVAVLAIAVVEILKLRRLAS